MGSNMKNHEKRKQPQPTRGTIDRLAAAIYPSLAMLAGMELGVFTELGEGVQLSMVRYGLPLRWPNYEQRIGSSMENFVGDAAHDQAGYTRPAMG